MPSYRLEHMTCTLHMINTTRLLDFGCLDTMRYVPECNRTYEVNAALKNTETSLKMY